MKDSNSLEKISLIERKSNMEVVMWKLLKNDLIIEKSNKKNIIAFLVVALFVFGLFSYEKLENSQKLIDEKGVNINQ